MTSSNKILLICGKLIIAAGLVTGCGNNKNKEIDPALEEVIDDINGNLNGKAITAAELNSIDGISGAIEGGRLYKSISSSFKEWYF